MADTTIVDVANRAKVSPATVSRVMRGQGRVGPRTRQRVLRVAGQLGYRVNRSAQSLRTRRTLTLGLVLPGTYGAPFYSALADVLSQASAARGYTIIQCTTNYDAARELRNLEMLLSHRVDGVVLINLADAENLRVLDKAAVPYCLIERPSQLIPKLGGVLIDHLYGVEEGIGHLIGLGHRRIHFVGAGPESLRGDPIERQRLEGFLSAMKGAGIAVEAGMIHLGDFHSPEAGRQLVRRVLAFPDHPTALFLTSDNVAIGVLQELYSRQTRVPEDISVMNFEDSGGAFMVPPLTRIHMPAEEAAREAVDLLISRIDQPEAPICCRTVRPRLVIGESARAL